MSRDGMLAAGVSLFRKLIRKWEGPRVDPQINAHLEPSDSYWPARECNVRLITSVSLLHLLPDPRLYHQLQLAHIRPHTSLIESHMLPHTVCVSLTLIRHISVLVLPFLLWTPWSISPIATQLEEQILVYNRWIGVFVQTSCLHKPVEKQYADLNSSDSDQHVSTVSGRV